MPRASYRQWLRVGVVGLFFLVGLALLLLIAFPGLISLDFYKTYLLAQVESRLNGTIEVSEVSLSVFPGVHVVLEGIAFLAPERVIPVFSADRLSLNLSLLFLLRGDIVVKRLEVDRPRFNLRADPQAYLHFFDFLLDPGDGSIPAFNVLGFSSSLREVAVRDGQIGITPHEQRDDMPDIRIERVNLTVTTSGPRKPLEFSIGGILPHDKADAKIHVTGTVSAETTHLSPSGDSPFGHTLVGTTRISSLDLARLGPYIGTNGKSGFDGLADLEGVVTVTLLPTSRRIRVQDITLQMGTGSLSGSVGFQQADDEPWTFQGEISTSPFDLETALIAFSPRLDGTWFHETMARSEIAGNARILHASVSGVLGKVSPSDTAVTAEVELDDLRGRFGEERVPFEQVKASLILQDDTLELRSLSGRYGGTDVLSGIAIVTSLYDRADMDATMTFLVPTSEFLDFFGEDDRPQEKREDVWGYESPTGDGVLTLSMTGPLHPDADALELEGVFQSRGMGFRSTWLDLPVSKLLGRLVFSPKGVELADLKGRVGRARMWVNAHFADDESTLWLQSHADAKELLSLVLAKANMSPLSPDTRVQGTTHVDLKAERHGDTTTISATLDLKQTGYHGESGTSKPPGLAASADAKIVLHGETQVEIQRLRFHLAPLLLTASGHIARTTPPRYSVSVASNLVRLEEFHERAPEVTIRGFHPDAGLLDAKLTVTGVGVEPKAIGLDGTISLLHGRMRVPDATGAKLLTIEEVNAALQFSQEEDGRIEIGVLSAAFEGSRVHVNGAITGLHAFPRVRVSVDAPQFDFERVIPRDGPLPLRELLTSLSRTTILQSDIHVGRGQYKGVTWQDMHFAATGMDGVVTLELLNARSGDGSLHAHTTIRLLEDEPIGMDGRAQFTAVPAQDIVALFHGNDRLIFGRADVDGALTGNEDHEQGVSATLNGRVSLTLSDGRIRKFTALSKMLNLLNLPQLLSGYVPDLSSEGLAYDTITATLVIEEGVITIKELSLNSPVLKIGGAGRYDITNDNVDVVMAVSPLGSYENILNNIPVLNKILAGGDQRRGVLTALFEVRGRLSDPEVTIMPGESVTSGLTGLAHLAFDILMNTILLPRELIAPTAQGER